MSDLNKKSVLRRAYEEARQLPPADWTAFLNKMCGTDERLRLELLQLLAASERRGANQLEAIIKTVSHTQLEVTAEQVAAHSARAVEESLTPQIDGFELLERLGVGGMGVVYRAVQQGPLARQVAVKVIKPGMDTVEVVRRFRSEQNAIAQMAHPNIASVYEAGVTKSGHPYFAMEMVEGEPIDQYVNKLQLPITERLSYFLAVLAAVEHAHGRGILHRDLKPSNVIVCQLDGKPTVKVIDFGVAKVIAANSNNLTEFTHFAQLVGTPLYMSPEQASHQPLDVRSDVYALGSLLYKLLSGTTPIDPSKLKSKTIDQVRKLLCDKQVVKPSVRDPQCGCPDELDWITLKSIEKDPNRRYQTVAEFAEDIQRFLQHRPVSAKRPSLWYQGYKLLTRNWQSLAATTTLLCLGSLLGILCVHLWRGERVAIQPPLADSASATLVVAPTLPANVQMRQAQSKDEAATLKQMFDAFSHYRLDQIPRFPLPREANGSFLRADDPLSVSGDSPSLRQFLTSMGSPRPLRRFEHAGAVASIVVSADKRIMAAACEDKYAWIWNLESSELIGRLGPHPHDVTAITFSPDEKHLIVGDRHGFFSYWRVDEALKTGRLPSGSEFVHRTEERDGGVESLAFSPNGKWLVAGIRYDQVAVFNAEGEELYKLYHGELNRLPRYEALAFQPGTGHLIVSHPMGKLDVWDLESRGQLLEYQFLPALDDAVHIRGFGLVGEDQQFLVGATSSSPDLRVFSTATQKLVSSLQVGVPDPLVVSETPDHKFCVVGYTGGKLVLGKLPNADSESSFERLVLQLHDTNSQINSIAWLDGQRFLTSGTDGKVQEWSMPHLLPRSELDIPECRQAFFDGTLIGYFRQRRSDSDMRTWIEIRDMAKRTLPTRISLEPRQLENSGPLELKDLCRINATRKLLAVSQDDCRAVSIYDIQSGTELSTLELLSHGAMPAQNSDASPEHKIWKLRWSRNGETLAVMSGDPTLNLRPTQLTIVSVDENGKCEQESKFSFEGLTDMLPLETGSEFIAIVQRDWQEYRAEVRRYDVQTGEFQALVRLTNFPNELAVSASQQYIALQASSGLLVLNSRTGERRADIPAQMPYSLRFVDQDRILVYAEVSGDLQAYHLPTRSDLGLLRRGAGERNINAVWPACSPTACDFFFVQGEESGGIRLQAIGPSLHTLAP